MGLHDEDHEANRPEAAPASTAGMLRAAIGAALSVGLLAGVCDAWLASSASEDALRWAGVAAAVAMDCGALAAILIPLGLILQLVARGKSERSLLLFHTTLGLFIALFAGLQAWRGDGLSQAGLLGGKVAGLVVLPAAAWLLVRSRPTIQLTARILAVGLILAFCLASLRSPASTLAAGAGETRGVVVLALPELQAADLDGLPELAGLVQRGTLVSSVRASHGELVAWMAELRERDVEGWRRRFRGELVVEKLVAQAWRQRAGELRARRLVMSQQRASESPNWSLLRLEDDASSSSADDLLGSLLRELDAVGSLEQTLILVIGLPPEGDHESLVFRVPLMLANTRLVPHGKRVTTEVGLEQVLPTVLRLMGLSGESDGEPGFEALILGVQRGEDRE